MRKTECIAVKFDKSRPEESLFGYWKANPIRVLNCKYLVAVDQDNEYKIDRVAEIDKRNLQLVDGRVYIHPKSHSNHSPLIEDSPLLGKVVENFKGSNPVKYFYIEDLK